MGVICGLFVSNDIKIMNKFEKISFKKISGIIFMISMLSACISADHRSDPNTFKSLQEGKIPITNTQAFSDCLMDGFDVSHVDPGTRARQQRRANGYRVDVLDNNGLLISVDIFEDGHVEFFESKAATFIPTAKERKVFEECLKQFQTTN